MPFFVQVNPKESSLLLDNEKLFLFLFVIFSGEMEIKGRIPVCAIAKEREHL